MDAVSIDTLARKDLGWTKDFVTLEAIDAASADSVERSNLHDGLRQAGYIFTADHGGGYAPGKDLADKSAATKVEKAEQAAASADPDALRREALDWALKFAEHGAMGDQDPVTCALRVEAFLRGDYDVVPA